MAANLEQIVDDLSGLTVIEAAELSKMLEEKWGVSAAAPVAVAAVADAGGIDQALATGALARRVYITMSEAVVPLGSPRSGPSTRPTD